MTTATETRTFDAMAAKIMLTETDPVKRQRLLAYGARLARQAIGDECPECGNDIANEDNGHAGRWLEFRCASCDHRWGPGTEA